MLGLYEGTSPRSSKGSRSGVVGRIVGNKVGYMLVIMGTQDATTGKDEAGQQGVRHSVLHPEFP